MTSLKPSSLWKGQLRVNSPAVQDYAHRVAESIPSEDSERFARKMIYWLTHEPLHPIILTAEPDGILAIARGQSRFLAAVILGRTWPCRVFAYHKPNSDPRYWIEQILLKAKQCTVRANRPEDPQDPIPGFKLALNQIALPKHRPANYAEWCLFLDLAL